MKLLYPECTPIYNLKATGKKLFLPPLLILFRTVSTKVARIKLTVIKNRGAILKQTRIVKFRKPLKKLQFLKFYNEILQFCNKRIF